LRRSDGGVWRSAIAIWLTWEGSPLVSPCLECAAFGFLACPGDGGVGDGWVVDRRLGGGICQFVACEALVPWDLPDLDSYGGVCLDD
jgi:hypothetical protein